MKNKEFISKIKSNIAENGLHITIVSGGQEPRYAYTVGLYAQKGTELIFAGGIFYSRKDVLRILNNIAEKIKSGNSNSTYNIGSLGKFTLREVHSSWSSMMMLSVCDYFNLQKINAYQIIPERKNFTLDIPDMSQVWSAKEQSVWKWLKEEWTFEVSDKTMVVTNLDALKGNPVTEVMRWEREEWEMFSGAGPEVDEKDLRVVPIGTLLGIDSSLLPALLLEVKKGMWREGISHGWNDWG